MMVVAVVVMTLGALAVGLHWSTAVVQQARGQTVADLGALAGAAHGRGAAEEVVVANGWQLGSAHQEGAVVVVSVRRADRRAAAAARACVVLPGHEGRSPAPCR
jgi:outer membrane lipoprotein SlyB